MDLENGGSPPRGGRLQVRPRGVSENVVVRFDGYIRVSRVGGREGDSYRSPRDQREAIERLAAANGLELGEVVVEEDVSGAKRTGGIRSRS